MKQKNLSKDSEMKLKMIENNTVGLDDTFNFKCRMCGNCCRNRMDIMLNPYDIYNLSKYLRIEPKELTTKYCIHYIGSDSKLPLLLLRYEGEDNHCILLSENGCSVHDAKPTMCALYPLGRYIRYDTDESYKDNNKEIKYILQPEICQHDNEQHVVKDWLSQFKIDSNDVNYIMWSNIASQLSKNIFYFTERGDYEKLHILYLDAITKIYWNYNIYKDFTPQFERNIREIKNLVTSLKLM